MTKYTTFPTRAHSDNSAFIKYATNIGRAYRNQAMGLIDVCRRFSQVAPQHALQDDDLRRVLRFCDLVLRSAADSGKEVTEEANQRFNDATQVLSRYSERWHPGHQGSPPSVNEVMEDTKLQDDPLRPTRGFRRSPMDFRLGDNLDLGFGPLITIDFVLLQSPFASARDPDTVIIRQVLSNDPRLPEIIWNFSRFEGHACITLEQNPHFYSSHPTDERAHLPRFHLSPIEDSGKPWRHLRTIYVLIDRPGRVFLETEPITRSFGNVWTMNNFLILKDHRGSLEGEKISALPKNLSHCVQQVAFPVSGAHASDHRCLRPIPTTSMDTPALRRTLDDWTVLSHSASHSNHIHIYDAGRLRRLRLPGSTGMDLPPPPPPTSERPGYHVLLLYTSIESINDDILLNVFDYYRLFDKKSWNFRLGWCKLSHVCRRWRNLVYESAFHLDMHILCTNGTPMVDTLSHLPSLPLVIDYQDAPLPISAKDELGISRVLQLHDRVRRAALSIPPASLHNLLALMDDSFPILDHLCLSSTAKETDADLKLPTNFMAPHLCHLTLLGIGLPTGLPLLSSTIALVTLTLGNIQSSGYFPPKHLITRLRSLPQLEELSIGFSIPIPRPRAEGELLDALTSVTLPALKRLTFRGVSAYLESLVAQLSAPVLEHLGITIFNQIAFTLPHLSHFTRTTAGLKLLFAAVVFESDAVSVVMDHRRQQQGYASPSFSFRLMCQQFDWQVDCAAEICIALMPALSGVEGLTLDFDRQRIPIEWQDNTVDGTTWRELLGPFVGARELRICHSLTWQLSFALEMDDAGLDPMLLPSLQELVPRLEEDHELENNAFGSFVDARRIAGRPVRVSPSPPRAQPVWSEQHNPPEADLALHTRSTLRGWFREAVIDRIRNRMGQR